MRRTFIAAFGLSVLCIGLATAPATAEEKDVFDYDGFRSAPDDVTRIVFIGDAGTHGPPGNHEFVAGSLLMARTLNAAYPKSHSVVFSSKNWPGEDVLSRADAIIVGLNHGKRAALDENILAATRRGAGFMAIHFGVEVDKGEQGQNFLAWMGGYFEPFWSVNPWWVPEFKEFPDHPTARGLKPFRIRDEWYYHMRFADGMRGVTPVLKAVAPLDTLGSKGEPSPRAGNPAVYKAVSAGEPQVMAWAYDRPDGGRGYGFTGMHLHVNFREDNFRTALLNGAAWVAGLEVPEEGVPSDTPSNEHLDELIAEAKAAIQDGK